MRAHNAKHFAAIAALVGGTCTITGLDAQPYPTKPIRVFIPAAPGSNNGIFFRTVAPSMGATLGQQLIADYRPGGGGLVGAALTVKSPKAERKGRQESRNLSLLFLLSSRPLR